MDDQQIPDEAEEEEEEAAEGDDTEVEEEEDDTEAKAVMAAAVAVEEEADGGRRSRHGGYISRSSRMLTGHAHGHKYMAQSATILRPIVGRADDCTHFMKPCVFHLF